MFKYIYEKNQFECALRIKWRHKVQTDTERICLKDYHHKLAESADSKCWMMMMPFLFTFCEKSNTEQRIF